MIQFTAAQACRKRGRLVLELGVTGLDLRRDLFYKGTFFQVSCSYGPGRYITYEQQGHDYPIAFVRWMRNDFQAVLDAVAAGYLSTELLISHRFLLMKLLQLIPYLVLLNLHGSNSVSRYLETFQKTIHYRLSRYFSH